DAHWAEGTKVWFVMIKDAKGRFPGNPLWGDGWGWALFKSDAPDTQIATDFKKDCLGCHIPAQETDWAYVSGYPVLSAKRAAGARAPFDDSRRILMRKYVLFAMAGVGLMSAGLWPRTTPAVVAQTQGSTAVFLPDGKVKLPTGFRKWVFVGAPLTPNGLN